MFVRPSWKPHSTEEAYALIDEHPWALLVSNHADGPMATNLPLLINQRQGERLTLVGHIARSNSHADLLLSSSGPVLCVFEGPSAYVTASWYPNRDMPSTIYYTAVHCYGRVTIQEEAELDRWLEILTRRMESPIPDGWRTDEIPRSEITRRFKGIVGFEIEVDRLEAKFKLGQDEPQKDALAVAHRLQGSSERSRQLLGDMVERYNAHRPE